MIVLRSEKGSPLTSDEVDGNFTDLDERVTEFEENPPVPNNISNIIVNAGQMTIYLEGGASYGPFPLPRSDFRPAITESVEVQTDGTYELLAGDANKYKRFDAAVTVIVNAGIDMLVDCEIYLRGAGGIVTVEWATDVTVNVPEGFLAATAVVGGTLMLKRVGDDEYDLEGRLAEDVTA